MANGMTVISWRELRKGESLRGFVSLALPSGLHLIDCAFHQRADGTKWVSMPARNFKKDDGTTAWVSLIDFSSRAVRDAFTKQAVAAVEKYFSEHKDKKPAAAKEEDAEGIPF